MEYYSLTKEIPIKYRTKVLVVGGGSAGIPAAIASARNNVDTMLIDKFGCVGGMATTGLVGPFMTSFDAQGKRQIIKGIFEEFVCRMERAGGAIHPSKVRAGSSYSSFLVRGHDHVGPFNVEAFKLTAIEMLEEAGVKVLLHSTFVDTITDGNNVKGIIIANKSGLQIIEADIIIDCTGDADVAASAGVPFHLGDGENNIMQPATMFFRIGGTESDKIRQSIEENINKIGFFNGVLLGAFNWKISEAREKGEWNIARLHVGMYECVKKGDWRINTSRILDVDGTNPEDLTRAEIEGRKQVAAIVDFMKKNIPGCENAYLIDTAFTIGIRETRHIIGEYVMTKEDVLNAVISDDAIAIASDSIDIHAKGNSSSGEYAVIKKGSCYGIPYRCLIPLKIENLYVAGRSVSATSEAASAIRVMPPCFAMGEAAGTAAALSLKSNCGPRDLDIQLLQNTLKKQNVVLE